MKRSDSDSNISVDSGALSNSSDMDSDLDTINIPCKCPCGRIDFKHCMQPPPDCLDKGFAEMDLSTGEDSKKAQDYMEHQLSAELKVLKNEFVRFGVAVRAFVQSIPNKEKVLEDILKLYGQKVESSDFYGLFAQIIKDTDFINFEPLKNTLKACTSECAAAGLARSDLQQDAEMASEKYDEAFQKFAQHRVFKMSHHLQEISATKTSHKELKIKIEEEFKKFPLHRIFHFKNIVQQILKLADNVPLQVTSVKEGCVEITFQLIGEAGNIPFQLSIEQKRELASQRISMLECAGDVEYCCCELFKDEVCCFNNQIACAIK